MIVDLKQRNENEDITTKEITTRKIILHLISLFGYMRYDEIVDFFPAVDEKNISANLNELIRTRQLTKKMIVQHSAYYTTYMQSIKGIGMKNRQKYYEICCFLRYLLNSKDDEGYLINEIDCIGTNTFPFDIFIVCNNTVYDIAHCTNNNIATYGQVLARIDKEWDKTEEYFKRRQSASAPYLITEDKNRIIIVDDVADLDFIHFNKVKYIVCRQGENFLIKPGD